MKTVCHLTHTSGTNARRLGSETFIKQFLRLMGKAELETRPTFKVPGGVPQDTTTPALSCY